MSDKNPRAACPYFHSAYNALLRCGDPARVQIVTRFAQLTRKRMYIRKHCCDEKRWEGCARALLLMETEENMAETGFRPAT
ncbi:MAG: hypothetical protein ACOX17_01820 [Christensenellales bacterium]|jgi:hypothetical protein